jgi:signal transduction histidine kinase
MSTAPGETSTPDRPPERPRRPSERPRRRRFAFRSVYLRFAVVFLGIWWLFNGATLVMIMQLLSDTTMQEIRSLVGLILLNNAILGTVVILIAVRSIVRPIKRLSVAAQEVAHGNFDMQVQVGNQDEIGRLAADFNTMVTEIAGTDKMRREFVSNVSHEFRTPMTSIRGFARLMAENPTDSEMVGENSGIIINESDRLIELSSNLLRLSELDAKTIHIETEFSLDEQIRQAILSLEPHWGPKGIGFDVDLPTVTYRGEEELLRQVWLNLLENAIKFSHDDGTIKVGLARRETVVCVSVSDNGIGIANEDLPHIFDRFYKGTSGKSGNGLGMSIVQKIMQFIGGSISVESEADKGTTVTVELPTG